MQVKYGFTITRNTHTGKTEFLTLKGFRTEKSILDNKLEKLTFNKIEGTKKVLELRKDCRLPAMKRSIILNY